MAKTTLYAELLAHTPLPEAVVAMGAKLCYSGADVMALSERVKEKDQQSYLQKLIDMGHLSPVEHVSFSFGVQGVSRALLAQVTRHRIASFSVQSQRYVTQTGEQGFSYVVPPSVAALGPDAVQRYENQMAQMASWYDDWVAVLGDDRKEDARFVLPNACETRMIVTMNARELTHFFGLRCCERAQWEIRALAWAMLGHVLRVSPALFGSAGPSCVYARCGEGKMTCGRAAEIQRKHRSLLAFVAAEGDHADFAARLSDWAMRETQARADHERKE